MRKLREPGEHRRLAKRIQGGIQMRQQESKKTRKKGGGQRLLEGRITWAVHHQEIVWIVRWGV